jgi:competence protein ComEA
MGAGPGRHAARPLSWRRRLAGALLDRTPTGASGLTSTHVLVLALVGVGAVLVALWWLTGARPRPAPVGEAAIVEPVPADVGTAGAHVPKSSPGASASATGAIEPTSPASAPPAATGGTVASAPAEVVVDVAGKVRRPGIVVLPAGARVADALKAAGGLRPAADTTGLNLARPLQDGEQVLVGLAAVTAPPATTAPDPSATSGTPILVNLNTATMEQLDTLPGIGPVTAQSILDWRAEHTAFSSVDELLEVDGIGDATLADLRDLVTV